LWEFDVRIVLHIKSNDTSMLIYNNAVTPHELRGNKVMRLIPCPRKNNLQDNITKMPRYANVSDMGYNLGNYTQI